MRPAPYSSHYSFTRLEAGDYTVAEVLPWGWGQTFPDGLGFVESAALVGGSHAVAVDDDSAESPAVADLDRDGRPDRIMASRTADRLSVLLNRGDGVFAPAVAVPIAFRPYGVAAADVNGDGNPDVVTAGADGGEVMVLLPDETTRQIVLRDDGRGGDPSAGDGEYTARFTNTAQAGYYRVVFNAERFGLPSVRKRPMNPTPDRGVSGEGPAGRGRCR